MNHHIEIDLTRISDRNTQSFIEYVLDRANRHGVQVKLFNTRQVAYGEDSAITCNGYFSDLPKPTFVVACGQPEWLPIFIHESCHMDQWIEQSPYWVGNKICEVESSSILDLWTSGYVELNDVNKWDIIRRSRNVELDCERRAVGRIKQFELPIDVIDYIRKANAYVWFYNIVGEHRKWYEIGREPYNNPKIYEVMPTLLMDDGKYEPEVMPEYLKSLLLTALG